MKFTYLLGFFALIVIAITCSTDDGITLTDAKTTTKETTTPAPTAPPKSRDPKYASKRIVNVEYYDNSVNQKPVALYTRFLTTDVSKCDITEAEICILGVNGEGDKYQNRIAKLTRISTDTGRELRGTIRNRVYYMKLKACDDDSWSDSEARQYDLADIEVEEFNTMTKGTSFQVDKAHTSWECDLPPKFGAPLTPVTPAPASGTEQFQPISSYDINITDNSLKNKGIRDIHVTSTHAYILTSESSSSGTSYNGKLYKYNIKTKTLETPITGQILTDDGGRKALRLAGDGMRLYVGYTSPTTSHIESRLYSSFTTAEGSPRSKDLTIERSSDWTAELEGKLRKNNIVSMVTHAAGLELLVTYLTHADTAQAYYGVAYTKSNMTHNAGIAPIPSAQFGLSIGHTLGSAIYEERYCVLWYASTARRGLSCRPLGDGYLIKRSGDWKTTDISILDSAARGFTALNGVGWIAKSSAKGTTLHAIQLSKTTPPNPFAE